MFLYILTLFTPASMYVCINYLRSTFLTYTICRSWMRSSCHTYSSNISTRLLLHTFATHTHIPLAKGLLENPRRTYNVVGSTGHHLYSALFFARMFARKIGTISAAKWRHTRFYILIFLSKWKKPVVIMKYQTIRNIILDSCIRE